LKRGTPAREKEERLRGGILTHGASEGPDEKLVDFKRRENILGVETASPEGKRKKSKSRAGKRRTALAEKN